MKELIYSNNMARAQINYNNLTSQEKPYLSFDYDQLFYTSKEKIYIKNKNTFLLTNEQINEIEGFLNKLFSQKDKIEINKVIQSLQSFLNNTDWMIIRELETGKRIPLNIKQQREDTRNKIDEMRKLL
jgi:hypothetical protein